jgi:hypothetical protein
MRAALAILALALGACGDDLKPAQPDAAEPDASTTNAVGPCLDRPDRLDTAPSTQLPCELISPGFQP